MKDKLKHILNTFSESETQEFHYYLRKYKSSGKLLIHGLAIELADQSELSANELIQKLGLSSKPAYDALRRDLFQKLKEFISVVTFRSSNTKRAKLQQEINLVQYLINQSEQELAQFYLEKLEIEAEKTNNYLILEQANLIRQDISRDPKELLDLTQKWEYINALAEVERKLSIAKTELKAIVELARKEGTLVDFKTQAIRIAVKYQFGEVVFQQPAFFLELMLLSRMVATASKNYGEFLAFIQPRYEQLKSEANWKAVEPHIEVHLDYIMAHCLYRNHQFQQAEEIARQCVQKIKTLDPLYQAKLYVKAVLLQASIFAYSNRIQEAILTIESQIHLADWKEIEQYNIQLNLLVYYFFAEDFDNCHQILSSILSNKSNAQKIMGKEWMLKVDLIEITLLYEITLYDQSMNRIRAIERNYAEMIKQPAYSRVKVFTNSIRSILKSGADIERSSTYAKIAKGFEQTEGLDTDIQAIAFYCWVKSKIEGEAFYTILMDMLNSTFSYLKYQSDQA